MNSDGPRAELGSRTEHSNKEMDSTGLPLISVIIPTKNSEQTLRECLSSVRAQTYRNFEIIVVDNFSSDSTVALAKQYADLVLQGGPERSSQVKLGVANSKGDFVYKIDSDFVLEPTVLEKAVKAALRSEEHTSELQSPCNLVCRL